MTLIVALRHKGKVYMGGDRLGSSAQNKFIAKLPKIMKHNGLLMGFCGTFNIQSILHHRMDILQVQNSSLDKYIHTKFLDDLGDHVDAASGGKNDGADGDVLIAANDKIYLVESLASVIEIDAEFYAIGSGYEYALGALQVLSENKRMSPKTKLKIAFEAVVKHCPSVGMPMDIISDEGKQ